MVARLEFEWEICKVAIKYRRPLSTELRWRHSELGNITKEVKKIGVLYVFLVGDVSHVKKIVYIIFRALGRLDVVIQMRIPVDTIPMSFCFASHAATYTYVQCIYGSCHQKTHRSDKQLAHRKTPGIPHYYLGHVHHAACSAGSANLFFVWCSSCLATLPVTRMALLSETLMPKALLMLEVTQMCNAKDSTRTPSHRRVGPVSQARVPRSDVA